MRLHGIESQPNPFYILDHARSRMALMLTRNVSGAPWCVRRWASDDAHIAAATARALNPSPPVATVQPRANPASPRTPTEWNRGSHNLKHLRNPPQSQLRCTQIDKRPTRGMDSSAGGPRVQEQAPHSGSAERGHPSSRDRDRHRTPTDLLDAARYPAPVPSLGRHGKLQFRSKGSRQNDRDFCLNFPASSTGSKCATSAPRAGALPSHARVA